MRIESFTFNAFEENTYLLIDQGKEAAIIDPGCYEREEQLNLREFVEKEGLSVKYIINTHCHIDHVLGNQYAQNTFQAKLMIPANEIHTLHAVKVYAPNYGFVHYQEAQPDGFLQEGQTIHFGSTTLEVLYVPGHSAGHIGLFNRRDKQLIIGDVLFFHSIGRTDLPGGNHELLIRNIHEKLFSLGDDVIVYPGHGPTTTIGEEKANNPYCAIEV